MTGIKTMNQSFRTSASHPLRLDGLKVGAGTLSLTFCPGKQASSNLDPRLWRRDLDADLDVICDAGVKIVVSLVNEAEMAQFKVPGLGEGVIQRGMEWLHLPFPDGSAPDEAWLAHWRSVSLKLHQALDAGGHVVVHCRGGIERAPTVAALLLIERGDGVEEALDRLRKVREDAKPLPAQRKVLEAHAKLPNREAALIRASLMGGAVGDALGAEIEFWSLDQIRRRFPGGVDEILRHQGKRGAITDDTQITLFTAERLIRAQVRGTLKGICHPPGVVHHALQRWLVTQGERPKTAELCKVGLVADPRLHAQRAPGMTCLSALRAAKDFGALARNDSKGCGTIMRVAPIGLA